MSRWFGVGLNKIVLGVLYLRGYTASLSGNDKIRPRTSGILHLVHSTTLRMVFTQDKKHSDKER